MRTIKVKTDGAVIRGRRYGAGTYEAPVQVEFEGPGYYWLEPVVQSRGWRWSDIDIYLGECATEADLMAAIAEVTTACIETADPIWLAGAKTERSHLTEALAVNFG
jgi:hypothetical protein